MLVSNESRVPWTSTELVDVVKDEVVAQEAWLTLVYFNLHQVLVCIEIVIAQLDVRVDSHSAPPNIDLVPIS